MREHTTILMLAASAALGVAAIQGCQLSDLIQTKTPITVQKSDGLPAKLPLSQARGEYESWRSDVQRVDAEWRESIQSGDEMVGLLEGFGLTALEQYSPLAGPAAMPLVLLGGYFFGNRGKVKGKEASFVKGQKIAAEVISGVKA